jgi:DNA-binding beta-propeller fold protein YncE
MKPCSGVKLCATENAWPYLNQLDSSVNLVRSISLGNVSYGSFALDKAGTLYVSANGNIEVFPRGRTAPSVTLKEPSGPGGSAIDSRNELVVGFPYLNEVAIESLPSGKILRTINTIGAGDDVALDEANGYLYAVNALGQTLQWYNFHTGRPLGFLSEVYLQIAVDPAK